MRGIQSLPSLCQAKPVPVLCAAAPQLSSRLLLGWVQLVLPVLCLQACWLLAGSVRSHGCRREVLKLHLRLVWSIDHPFLCGVWVVFLSSLVLVCDGGGKLTVAACLAML